MLECVQTTWLHCVASSIVGTVVVQDVCGVWVLHGLHVLDKASNLVEQAR